MTIIKQIVKTSEKSFQALYLASAQLHSFPIKIRAAAQRGWIPAVLMWRPLNKIQTFIANGYMDDISFGGAFCYTRKNGLRREGGGEARTRFSADLGIHDTYNMRFLVPEFSEYFIFFRNKMFPYFLNQFWKLRGILSLNADIENRSGIETLATFCP